MPFGNLKIREWSLKKKQKEKEKEEEHFVKYCKLFQARTDLIWYLKSYTEKWKCHNFVNKYFSRRECTLFYFCTVGIKSYLFFFTVLSMGSFPKLWLIIKPRGTIKSNTGMPHLKATPLPFCKPLLINKVHADPINISDED